MRFLKTLIGKSLFALAIFIGGGLVSASAEEGEPNQDVPTQDAPAAEESAEVTYVQVAFEEEYGGKLQQCIS